MDDMMDGKEYRLCPFRRSLVRQHRRTAQDRVEEKYTDRFSCCCGESCMAYRDGHCLRLEKPDNL